MQNDSNEMIRALHAYFLPGDVFEIRILDAVSIANRRPHIESGYFEYGRIEDVPGALSHISQYRGVYVTANPCKPELLARCANRVAPPERSATTADGNILVRRWLLVDCDAVRESGISSSEEEHLFAMAKAAEVEKGMMSLGFPAPIVIDSGNGAQLMFRIDLPAEDGGLVQSVLHEIAKCGDIHVQVDCSVFNPARIWRLPGTWNCKGDSIEARPHRIARIMRLPEDIHAHPAPRELLEKIAPASQTPLQESVATFDGFSIDQWIRLYCPEIDGKAQPYNGGRKWVFDVCPFNAEHTDRSAVLTESADGRLGFVCHHNGCKGNDWHALRMLRDIGYSTRRKMELSGVDLSEFGYEPTGEPLPEKEEEEAGEEFLVDDSDTPWRNVTDEDVEKAVAGTMLGDLSDIYASVCTPRLPIAASLLKAMVTVGCCLSQEATPEEMAAMYGGNMGGVMATGIQRARLQVNTGGGQGNNIYAILAGNSASGKDIGNLIDAFAAMPNPSAKHTGEGREDFLIGTSGSAEGIADTLLSKPNGLLTISEMQNWLDANHWQHNATSFLTEAFNKMSFSAVFSARGGKSSRRAADYCAPNIIANIQPEIFKRLAKVADVETGFLGRFLIARMPRFFGNPAIFDRMEKIEAIQNIASVFMRKKGIVAVQDGYMLPLQEVFMKNTAQRLDASWRRLVNEYYPRIAIQLSVTHDESTQGEDVVLTDECWRKAQTLVLWFFKNAEQMLTNISDIEDPRVMERERRFEAVFNAIKAIYKRKHNRIVLTSDISRYGVRFGALRSTAKERREAIDELLERGMVKQDGKGFRPMVDSF